MGKISSSSLYKQFEFFLQTAVQCEAQGLKVIFHILHDLWYYWICDLKDIRKKQQDLQMEKCFRWFFCLRKFSVYTERIF